MKEIKPHTLEDVISLNYFRKSVIITWEDVYRIIQENNINEAVLQIDKRINPKARVMLTNVRLIIAARGIVLEGTKPDGRLLSEGVEEWDMPVTWGHEGKKYLFAIHTYMGEWVFIR